MDQHQIETNLSESARQRLECVRVYDVIDSTNLEALHLLQAGAAGDCLLVADSQSAGRGRRGRSWQSPGGGGLYMSLLRHFDSSTAQLQALSLVCALSAYQVLADMGVAGHQLKWPNDLVVHKKKLAGILAESRHSERGSAIVFGIGINYSLDAHQKAVIDRPVVDLQELLEPLPGREVLAAKVCSALILNIETFLSEGFAPFQSAWNANDRYRDCDIVLDDGKHQLIGKSLGVDAEGALLLQSASGRQRIMGGEIFPSLRAREEAQ